MKQNQLIPLFVFGLTNLLSFSTQAALIDFQQLEHIDDQAIEQGSSYTEDGYVIREVSLSSVGFKTYGTQNSRYTGSTAMYNNLPGGVTTLTQINGNTFDLISIDLAELTGSNVADITFTRDGGYSQVFTLDGNAFGAETFFFDSGFLGSTSVNWGQETPFHQFDNINVTAVPIPAAAWLLGSALIGLFGIRKRQSKISLVPA